MAARWHPSALFVYELPGVGETVLRGAIPLLPPARGPGGLPDPAAILARAEALGLPRRAVARLERDPAAHLAQCGEVLRRLQAAGAWMITGADREYPPGWRRLAGEAPPLVCGIGDGQLLRRPGITVLNSRAVGEASVRAAHAAAEAAAAAGWTVVTSGNKAGYRILSVAARAAGAARAVVLDRGLLAALGHGPLRDRFGLMAGGLPFDPRTTAVASPFRPSSGHAAHNGPRRDLLVAAAADVAVAADIRPGGVMERICLRILDLGGCVLSWQGAHELLLAAGAAAVGSGAELEARLAEWKRTQVPV